MKTLTARRVRRARRIIQNDRCPVGPRIVHNWVWELEITDGSGTQWCPPADYVAHCSKCGAR